MTNHMHLLLDPGETPESLAQLMKRVAARRTRSVNRLEGRTGTLWESRYTSSSVETEQYLLACCRYIELHPVRARMREGLGRDQRRPKRLLARRDLVPRGTSL
jgi:putative transposase